MTREQTKEAIKVMQAWVDGEETQYEYRDDEGAWYELPDPNVPWNWTAANYRIKPREVLTDEQRKAIKVLYPWAKWFAVDDDRSGCLFKFKPEYSTEHGIWEDGTDDFFLAIQGMNSNPVDSLTEL